MLMFHSQGSLAMHVYRQATTLESTKAARSWFPWSPSVYLHAGVMKMNSELLCIVREQREKFLQISLRVWVML